MSRYRWGTGDPAAYRLAAGPFVSNAGTGSVRFTCVSILLVVAATDRPQEPVTHLRAHLTGPAGALAARGTTPFGAIAEVTRRAHDRLTRRTAGSVASWRWRVHLALALGLELDSCVDQLAEVAVGLVIASADRLPDVGAAARDGLTGAALRAALAARIGAVKAELTLGAFSPVWDAAAGFAAAHMIHRDTGAMRHALVVVGDAVTAADRPVFSGASFGDLGAFTAHSGPVAVRLERGEAEAPLAAVLNPAAAAARTRWSARIGGRR